MAETKQILEAIFNGIKPAYTACELAPVYPSGADKSQVPIIEDSGRYIIEFSGDGIAAKIEHFNDKISLLGARKEGEILSSDYTKLAETLFEIENANDKDIRYVVNDFTDTLVETFGTKLVKPIKSKLPTPVSKAAVKSGAVSYDPDTLANRFTAIYSELREEYKSNCEKYGEFLPEDFFMNHGAPVVVETIKKNNPTEMKRLFKLLNEIFEDGTTETQGIICVTILGALNNDIELLANCTDYMSDDLAVSAITVNKYLDSKAGKGAKMKLENPPAYKPKKKYNSIMSKIGM